MLIISTVAYPTPSAARERRSPKSCLLALPPAFEPLLGSGTVQGLPFLHGQLSIRVGIGALEPPLTAGLQLVLIDCAVAIGVVSLEEGGRVLGFAALALLLRHVCINFLFGDLAVPVRIETENGIGPPGRQLALPVRAIVVGIDEAEHHLNGS